MKFPILLISTLLALVLLPAGPAKADDKADLMQAFVSSFDSGSFRMRMREVGGASQQIATMEYQAPDRFRVITDEAEMIAVGDTVYMVMGGQTMRIPMNVGNLVERFRADEEIRKAQDKITVTAVEQDNIDGIDATRYDFEISDPKSSNRAWINNADGYLLRMEQTSQEGRRESTMILDYEDFGQIEIRTP